MYSMILYLAAIVALYHAQNLSLTGWAIVFILPVLSAGLALTAFLIRSVWPPRNLVSDVKQPTTVLGRPLLFPVTITHTRFKPVKNQFSHRVLLVGVPVGLNGSIGNVLSIADNGAQPEAAWKSWFHFDSSRYLHRGDHHLGLQSKLHRFLRSEGLDPAQWPYAYLLSVPQWLWWSRSVVSWWYLYSPARELDAIIMEINNSFLEKRNVLFRVNDPARSSEAELPSAPETLDTAQLVKSLPSLPRAKSYKGSWERHIYTSPFEKVEGLISNQFLDPLNEKSWSPTASLSNSTSVHSGGETRLTMRLSCCEPPIDPAKVSAISLLSLLVRWTMPVTLTTPRIIYEALRIEYLGLMRMMDKPVIRKGSISRGLTSTERALEPFFRRYLASRVQSSQSAVEVGYLPSRTLSTEPIYLHSPACGTTADKETQRIEIESLEPGFFTRIFQYPTIKEGITAETKPLGDRADSEARYLWVSDPDLLIALLSPDVTESKAANDGLLWHILFWLRGSRGPTELDFFIQTMPPSLRLLYCSTLIQHFLTERFAFGYPALLHLYGVVGTFVLGWLFSHLSFFRIGYPPLSSIAAYFVGSHVSGRVASKLAAKV